MRALVKQNERRKKDLSAHVGTTRGARGCLSLRVRFVSHDLKQAKHVECMLCSVRTVIYLLSVCTVVVGNWAVEVGKELEIVDNVKQTTCGRRKSERFRMQVVPKNWAYYHAGFRRSCEVLRLAHRPLAFNMACVQKTHIVETVVECSSTRTAEALQFGAHSSTLPNLLCPFVVDHHIPRHRPSGIVVLQ